MTTSNTLISPSKLTSPNGSVSPDKMILTKLTISSTFNTPSENITYDILTGDVLDPGINFLETHLISAEIAIFYRILEIGVIYFEYPEDKEYEKREALISLHIRIQNVQNGEIIHATNLTSKLSDLVEKELVDRLASFHYTFFPYEYTLQEKMKENPVQKKEN